MFNIDVLLGLETGAACWNRRANQAAILANCRAKSKAVSKALRSSALPCADFLLLAGADFAIFRH